MELAEKFEKFALVLIGAVILSVIGSFALDLSAARIFGADTGSSLAYEAKLVTHAKLLFSGLVNIAVAVWLFIQARERERSKWTWASLGLFFGLVALVLFVVFDIKSSASPTPSKET